MGELFRGLERYIYRGSGEAEARKEAAAVKKLWVALVALFFPAALVYVTVRRKNRG